MNYTIDKLITDLPSAEELKSLPEDGGAKWNRLVFEASPYLLQHAANPVDWYAWSEDAFSAAKQANKPIMLSIGYSTCHWCHVMEHESFEDEQVADLLNQYFICIKLDREERPDIDNLYMTVAQALVGRGGWPLNVFLTPDKEVFHAATYIPKHSRQYPNGVMPGMLDLIPHLGKIWQEDQERILNSAKTIMQDFSYASDAVADSNLEIATEQMQELSHQCYQNLNSNFDQVYGGFGSQPKFPSPHVLCFLLGYYKHSNDAEALAMVDKTLKQMRLGGIFDHIGLGFHRYSTDREWILPHFEKMLYDQAILMIAYAEAYSITQNPLYKQVVDEIFQYLSRDMLSSDNLFYSAEDADSEGEEGKFYTWTIGELEKLLDKKELEKFVQAYNIDKEGNFADEATGKLTGRNIPYLSEHCDIAMTVDKLYQARLERVHPLKDDKILTDWNALVIAALAIAYNATQETKYLDQAKASMQSLIELMFTNGVLAKSARQGKVSHHPASIDDYAYMTWALIELFNSSCDEEYIKLARTLTDSAINKFWDDKNYGFYYSDIENNDLPVNTKDLYDGAVPSANSVMVNNLLFLYRYSGDNHIKDTLDKQIYIMFEQTKRYPGGYTYLMATLERSFEPWQLACKR